MGLENNRPYNSHPENSRPSPIDDDLMWEAFHSRVQLERKLQMAITAQGTDSITVSNTLLATAIDASVAWAAYMETEPQDAMEFISETIRMLKDPQYVAEKLSDLPPDAI